MSPRGVAIPEVREQLFQAAHRVLLREGPRGLTGRAITREAGVATGLLHGHFTDLDDFLVAFVSDHGRQAGERLAALPARAGQGTVVGNLTGAALALGPDLPALAGLVTSRPALAARLREGVAFGAPVFARFEDQFATYLEAERRLGRVAPGTDTEGLALALFGAVHHVLLGGRTDAVGRVVAAIAAGLGAA